MEVLYCAYMYSLYLCVPYCLHVCMYVVYFRAYIVLVCIGMYIHAHAYFLIMQH